MTKPKLITSHLSSQDAAKLQGMMSLTLAPITGAERAQLRRDVAVEGIVACAKRKGLDLSPYPLMMESSVGGRHFELGCWLYYYSRKVGTQGIWARIDCVRRLLLDDYHRLNPHHDFFTAFNFGEREFDTCFEMNDGSQVLRALMGLRGAAVVDEKFAAMGWTDEYLSARGYLQAGACAEDAAAAAPEDPAVNADGQANLFSIA